jgi:hypothetical protein
MLCLVCHLHGLSEQTGVAAAIVPCPVFQASYCWSITGLPLLSLACL